MKHTRPHPGNKERKSGSREAAEAYWVLRDPEKRRVIRPLRHEGLSSTGFTGFRDFSDIFQAFSDIFGDVFGFPGRPGGCSPRPARSALRLALDFMDAAMGTEVTLEVPRVISCRTCGATGPSPAPRGFPVPNAGRAWFPHHGIFRSPPPVPAARG